MLFILLIWSSFFGFFPECAQAVSPEVQASTVKLVLNWKAEPEFGGFYQAAAQKIGNRTLEIIQGGVGTPTLQMVASKAVDFGISTSGEVLTGIAQGMDIVPLFAVYQKYPTVYIAHGESGFKSIYDLLGSARTTFAVQLGYPGFLQLKKWYELKTGKKVQTKLVPYQGGISHFLTSKDHVQQGILPAEVPLIQAEIRKKNEANKRAGRALEKDPLVFHLSETGYNPYMALLITRKDFIENNKEWFSDFMKAIRAGWVAYLKNGEEINRKLLELNPSLGAEMIKEAFLIQKELIQPQGFTDVQLGSMTKERWKVLARQLVDLGILSKQPPQPELDWDAAVDSLCKDFCL